MDESPKELPTRYGSVIGWARYYGTVHFFTAVLSYGGPDMDQAWWVSGETEPKTPEQMYDLLRGDWILFGYIEVQTSI